METPKLRIPEIDYMWRVSPKATPAMKVMGALVNGDGCEAWSATKDDDTQAVFCRIGGEHGGKCLRYGRAPDTSVLPALPEAVVSKIRPNNVRAGEFFETPYEGIGGGKPVADDIANDILKNKDQLPKTGKTYPVYNQEEYRLESAPEILYKGEKYVVLTGHPDLSDTQIDGVPVEEGKPYVFKIEKLRMDDKGHFEYPMIVAPIEPKGVPYTGNMDKTWMGREVLPKLAESLVPSKVDEQMIEQSYLGEKTLTTEDALKQAVENHANSDKGDEANKIRTAVRQKLKGNTH